MLSENSDAFYQNSDFRRFVLEPVFKKVIQSKAFADNHVNPIVNYELEQKGRVVTHVKFNFSKPAQLSLFGSTEAPEESSILNLQVNNDSKRLPDNLKRPYERLMEYGLTTPQAKSVIEIIPLAEVNKALYKLN